MDALLEQLKKGKFNEQIAVTSVQAEGLPEGVALSEAKKEDDTLPKQLIVTVEAIHAGMTKNKTFYPANKLEASAQTWVDPYERPVIKNHDTWTEPTGRVIEANFKQSILKPDTHTIELKLSITDKDTIEKVLDKRYQTLSIGGSTKEARCSICAKNVVSEGWCGHGRGRVYDGKEAHWIIGEMEFEEISWVNVPADVNARVISVQKVTKSAEGRKESVDGANLIDGILGEATGTEGEKTPDTIPVTDAAGTTPEGEGEKTPETTPVTEGEQTKTDAEKLAEALAEIETLKQERDAAISESETLKTEKKTIEDSLQERDAEIITLKDERDSFRTKNIALAKTAHSFLAERAVDLRIAVGEHSKEDREGLLSEYAKTPAKVLQDTITDLLEKPVKESKPRTSTPATSPAAVITDSKHSITDDEGNITESTKQTKDETPELTIQDLADRLTAALVRP